MQIICGSAAVPETIVGRILCALLFKFINRKSNVLANRSNFSCKSSACLQVPYDITFFFALLYSLLLLVVAFTHLSLVWWCIACLHIALHDILWPFNIVSMREGNGTTTTT